MPTFTVAAGDGRDRVRMGPVSVRVYEREAAVEEIRQLLDAAFAGRGGTLFVVAPAGLGKTSVLELAVAQAKGRFDIRTGGGDAVEATLPYGLIGQVLGGEDTSAVPDEAGDLSAAHRFYAALRRVQQAAAVRPLLLALDDLHWADPDSLALLYLLCRRAAHRARAGPDPAACPAHRAGSPSAASGPFRRSRRHRRWHGGGV